jgi:hypothetical protein
VRGEFEETNNQFRREIGRKEKPREMRLCRTKRRVALITLSVA